MEMRLRDIPSRVKAAIFGAWPQVGALPWLGERINAGGASLPAPAVNGSSALGLTAVYRAVSLLSDAASTAPPALYRRRTSGGREQVTNTAIARCLAALRQEDAETFAFGCALTGNGFLRVYRDGNGAPRELRGVPPWRVTLEVASGSGEIWYRICADASIEEAEELLPDRDVIHARYRTSGSNRLWGVAPIAACAPAFALALQSRDVVRTLFSNLSTPRGVLQSPGKVDPDTAKKLQHQWDTNWSGPGLGKTAVLANGLTYEPIPLNAVDSELLELIRTSNLDVSRCFGVPRQFIEEGATMTYASASEGTRALYALALKGFVTRLSRAIGQTLLARDEIAAGTAVEFDLSDLLVLPGAEMAEFLSKLANAGLVTPNEVRNQWLRLPDSLGGDVLRVPVNTQPSGAWAATDSKSYDALAVERRRLDQWRADLQDVADYLREHGADIPATMDPVPFDVSRYYHSKDTGVLQ
jgi:HK97 family phage portal protein